jgi:glucose-6-phosphate isomerase
MANLKFDFSGAFAENIGNEHGITSDDIKRILPTLQNIRIDFPFIRLASDKQLVNDIKYAADQVRCKFQNLVVLGIGGSALGLKTLAQAILPPYFNMLDTKSRGGAPRLFVCDNIDPDHFSALTKMLDWKETCVNVISKSGKTIETLAQFYIIRDILIKKLSARRWKEHTIITTDQNSGPLRTIAGEEKIPTFPVPQDISGRYSVLSAVGLFPAACAGIDIHSLLSGAADMANTCKDPNIENNPALKNAAIHYIMDTIKHHSISVMMPYSDSLALFADWYAQIWAESLGKKGAGPTPVKALGVTDQHSQLQLYMEGPNDKIITIVGAEKFRSKISIPDIASKENSYIGGRDLGEILSIEQKATTLALKQVSRPSITVTLPEISEYAIGQLIMLYQIQTAVSGKLYGINPFDQPGVELGKKLTREMLSRPSN